MNPIRPHVAVLVPILALLSLSACGGGGSSSTATTSALPMTGGGQSVTPMSLGDAGTQAGVASGDSVSVLKQLTVKKTIGSTVDPMNGDQNPYGLDVARSTSGKIKAGDFVICNFNNKANVQGTGTTIEVLHPTVGAVPMRLAQHKSLRGCDALALSPGDDPWVAAFSANDNPIFTSSGMFVTALTQYPWYRPFGQAFSPIGPTGGSAFYESNAADGSIVRINVDTSFNYTFDRIASGFGVNQGQPGSILGPSGLQYDTKLDRLYVIDGTTNTIVALNHVTTIPAGGIAVGPDGKTFSGPFAKRGKLIFAGAPLNGPISSALLPNGNLIVGNTLDPNGKNLMVEISTTTGHMLFVRNVDKGVGAAIFGMVATGTTDQNTKLYFN
ncbi:MAG: hypothetical protein ABI282_02850, partial [Candidatus Baltobacteraceae bacterium]